MQQLIVLADADGIIDMTPNAIAAHTSIPLDIIKKGITKLEEVDPYSRTPGEDGRRIVCIDEHRPWGWQIVNYLKYKHLKDSDEVREQNRVRAQRFRDKRNGTSRDVTLSNAESRHTDTDTDTERRGVHRSQGSRLPPGWFPHDALLAWATGERPDLDIASVVPKFRDYWLAVPGQKGRKTDWDATFRNFVRTENQSKAPSKPKVDL